MTTESGQKNIALSLSGGKDSTAVMLKLWEMGIEFIPVFFDTGWEFPQMYTHLRKLEQYTKIQIIRLKPKKSFDFMMFNHRIVARKGNLKGQIHRIGHGWPSINRRWCTRIKVETINKYAKSINAIQAIGIAFDEQHRVKFKNLISGKYRYPLIEWKITEKQALDICYFHGFNWDGLYEHYSRVSCFCCPLQSLTDLRTTRRNFPEIWAKMLEMDKKNPHHNRGFRDYNSVHDLERRFVQEDRQMVMWGGGTL